jgi:hypothetical protein
MRAGHDAREHHQAVVDPQVEERGEVSVVRSEDGDDREYAKAYGRRRTRQVNPPSMGHLETRIGL